MHTISEQFYLSDQSWHYCRVVSQGPHKLQVVIKRNSYDSQSYIYGNAFDPVHLSWNRLVTRPIETAACRGATYVRANESIIPFQKDAYSVLNEMLEILP